MHPELINDKGLSLNSFVYYILCVSSTIVSIIFICIPNFVGYGINSPYNGFLFFHNIML